MKVKNRSASRVVYRVPDMNIRRVYTPGEIKEVSKEEIEKLAYQPGGMYLLVNFLQVLGEEVNELDFEKEREYHFSEEDVKNLILNGTLDEFLDCLDFAPKGVIDLIKDYAVSLPMTDMNKADALRAATGFDAFKAFENQRAAQREDDNFKSALNGVPEGKKRRTEVVEEEKSVAAPTRRSDKYKIIQD